MAQKEFPQYFPQPGWVEHDPEEIWSTQIGVIAELFARHSVNLQELPPSVLPIKERPQ
jgi:glycerol kinase